MTMFKIDDLQAGYQLPDLPEFRGNSGEYDRRYNAIVQYDNVMEHEMDFVFSQLGVKGDHVDHPVVMTEPPCHLPASRGFITDLMFECYQVPALSFGIDSLFSYYYNAPKKTSAGTASGLIVSSGHTATHVIPILDGHWVSQHTKRLNVGGYHSTEFMQRLLQLKYHSTFPLKNYPLRHHAQALVLHHTYVALDYAQELRKYELDEAFLAEHEHLIQFPHPELQEQESADVIARKEQEREERKEKMRQRLREVANKKRQVKLDEKQRELDQLTRVLELAPKEMALETSQQQPQQSQDDSAHDMVAVNKEELEERKAQFMHELEKMGFVNEQELRREVSQLHQTITKIKNKMAGLDDSNDAEEHHPAPPPMPSFPLVDQPDDQLNQEQRKEKKKQRLLKAGWEARQRIRLEKQQKRQAELEQERQEEQRRLEDPQRYIQELREKRAEILQRIQQRKKLAQQQQHLEQSRHGGHKRRAAASQQRLTMIMSLADEEGLTVSGSQRKKRKGEEDDGFGMDDADWAIYRDIAVKEDDEESEDEEEHDQQQLDKIETLLIQYDDEFDPAEDLDSNERRNTLYCRLRFGPTGQLDNQDIPQHYQMRLNVERVRVPEILFQPHIIGVDQAGLSELLGTILKIYDDKSPLPNNAAGSSSAVRLGDRLTNDIFLTGSHTLFPGMQERIEREIRMIRPVESVVKVRRASDPRLDAWRGAAKWASEVYASGSKEIGKTFITRKEYEEKGSHYLKEHAYSNSV